MASPQLENGFLRIANEITAQVVKTPLLGAEFQILLFIISKTYGYNKKKDWISLIQYETGTGLSRPTVVKTLKNLVLKNIIIKTENLLVSFNKDYESWVVKPPLLVKCSTRTGKPGLTNIGKPGLTHKRHNTITKDIKEKISMKTINYDTGEEIQKPQRKKLTQDQNKLVMAVGALWANLLKTELKLEDHELPLKNCNIAIRNAYLKYNFNYDDFKAIFTDWLKKSKEDDKANFYFCLGEQNVTKWKLGKKKKDTPKTFVQLSDEIIL